MTTDMTLRNANRLLEIDREKLQGDVNDLSERYSGLKSAAQKALVALLYHTEQTRPIPESEDAIKALMVALAR